LYTFSGVPSPGESSLEPEPEPETETEPPKTYIKEMGCSVEILFLKREEVLANCSARCLNNCSRLRLWSVHSDSAGGQ